MVRSKQEKCEAEVTLDAQGELAGNAGRESGWVEEKQKYKLDEKQ